jgi:predicted CoA-binding protein
MIHAYVPSSDLQHDKPVTPVSIKETDVERVRAVKALHELGGDVAAVGVSVITPPPVTLDLLDDIAELGISKVWLQPGAESPEVVAKCADLGINALHAVDGAGPCLLIELGYDDTIVYSTTERLTRRTQVLR